MNEHTRALIAASAYAFVTGGKIAGLYDHAAGRHRRIAAEARDRHLQGYDGDRDARFGGTLPELRDASDGASIHLELGEGTVRGYDRASSTHFSCELGERRVQLYDHTAQAWFSFDVQVA